MLVSFLGSVTLATGQEPHLTLSVQARANLTMASALGPAVPVAHLASFTLI